MSGDPSFSIIVTAYNRRQYVMDAIRSLSLDSDSTVTPRPQVIVSKNFRSQNDDEELSRLGVRVLQTGDISVGEMLAAAVDECSGDYIAFLDDDDLFAPRKLERARSVLSGHSGTGYYHNGSSFFTGTSPKNPSTLDGQAAHVLEWPGHSIRLARTQLRYLLEANREQNLSSVVISRRVVNRSREYLSQITGLTDSFMLVAALAFSDRLIFDPFLGTMIRRHGLNTSVSERDLISRSETWRVIQAMTEHETHSKSVSTFVSVRQARDLLYDEARGIAKHPKRALKSMICLATSPLCTCVSHNLACIALGAVAQLGPFNGIVSRKTVAPSKSSLAR